MALFLLVVIKPCWAEASAASSIKTYDVLFSDRVYLKDLSNYDKFNMNKFEVQNIEFTIKTSNDTITVGYNKGMEEFNYYDMVNSIQEVLNIRYEDNTLEESYNIEKIPVTQITVLSTDEQIVKATINNCICKGSFKFTINEINKINEKKDLQAATDLETDVKSLEPNSSKGKKIDGSYHYKETNGHVSKTMWHKQSTGTNTKCKRNASSPHEGDGNSRYADGFQWYPNKVKANFTINKTTKPYVKNSTKLSYYYYKSALKNLQHDSNETLEMEVVFYNYPNETKPENKGLAFQKTTGSVYLTNQPGAYLDTGFLDELPCFCVGVKDANKLEAKKWYWWEITSKKGDYKGYANDGRFKVNAQRGYRYLYGGAFGIFSEEHEKVISYGKKSSQRWISGTNAWKLANEGKTWTCNTTDGPIS